MSGEHPQYRPGDVVNGHMLGADGHWVPIAQPGAAPGSPWAQGQAGQPLGFASTPTPPGYEQHGVPAQQYRPGDVVNGYVLNARYQWELLPETDETAPSRRPPGALAVGAGVLGLVPFVGVVFSVLAIVLGGRILVTRSSTSNRDAVLGAIAVVLGVILLVWQIQVF